MVKEEGQPRSATPASTAVSLTSNDTIVTRPLGGMEFMLYKLNRMQGSFSWTIADMTGPLTRDLLEGAVRATVFCHPQLRCTVENRRLVVTPFDTFMARHPQLVDEEPDADAHECVERLLQESPVRLGKGVTKLWKLVLTGREGAEQRRLVVINNHTILDGGGVTIWLSQFYKWMNDMLIKGMSADELLETLEPLPLTPAMEARFADTPERKARFLSPRWLTLRLQHALRFPSVPKAEADPPRPPKTLVHTHWLDEQTTKALVERARSEEASIASIVGAASALATRELIQGAKNPRIVMEFLVSLRGIMYMRGHKEVAETVGVAFTPLYQVLQPDRVMGSSGGSLWALARQIKVDLRKAIRSGQYMEAMKEAWLMKAASAIMVPAMLKGYMQKVQKGRYCALSLSSMGALETYISYPRGPIQAVRVEAGMGLQGVGPAAFVMCMTTRGCLGLSLSTPEPSISKEAAQSLLDGIVRHLRAACQ